MPSTSDFPTFLTTFRGRLTLWFGGLTFATLIGVGSYVGQIASSEIISASEESLYLRAKSAADLLATNLRERILEVDLLRYSPALTRGDLADEELRRLLDQRKAAHNEYAWIGVADPEGRVLQGTDGFLVGESVAQRPWFKEAMARDLFVGDMHEAVLLAKLLPQAVPDQPLRFIDFAAPIRDKNGAVRGVLGTHAHWSWVTETVESVVAERAATRDIDVLVADKSGKIVYPQALVDLNLPKRASAMNHAEVLGWNDGRFLTSVVSLKEEAPINLGWSIVLRQPLAAMEMPITKLWRQLIWSGLVVSLLIAFLGFRFASKISRPIEQLATAVVQAEKREEPPTYPEPQGIPELDKLTSSIKTTTASLLDRERELEALNASLESLVTERTRALIVANEQLEQLANSDALTGVYNRRRFNEKLHESFALAQRGSGLYALLIVDVDYFKRINDTFGHPVGDAVLQELAALLKRHVRQTDFVARYGGEEFVVLLHGVGDIPEGFTVAEKLREAVVANTFPQVGAVTISLGLSLFNPEDTLDSQIVKRADTALYVAKGKGRNCSEAVV